MSEDLDYIIAGYKKFRHKYFEGTNDLYEDLKNGQSPKTLVIACSDSRVDPAIILNCKPGDLFVVRNVANLVPPYENDKGHHGTSAALEFAVLGLQIKHIIILGHSFCGGIQALVKDPTQMQKKNFISRWMEIAKTALERTLENDPHKPFEKQVDDCAKFAIINSLNNLLTFPWIRERVTTQDISLHGWYFNIASGIIEEFNPKTEKFTELKTDS